jgi:hypothetical protein
MTSRNARLPTPASRPARGCGAGSASCARGRLCGLPVEARRRAGGDATSRARGRAPRSGRAGARRRSDALRPSRASTRGGATARCARQSAVSSIPACATSPHVEPALVQRGEDATARRSLARGSASGRTRSRSASAAPPPGSAMRGPERPRSARRRARARRSGGRPGTRAPRRARHRVLGPLTNAILLRPSAQRCRTASAAPCREWAGRCRPASPSRPADHDDRRGRRRSSSTWSSVRSSEARMRPST